MSEATTTIDLPVLGMTCAACVRRVEKAALAVPGVASAEVNLPLSRARIVLDAGATPRSAADAIRKAGYEVPADALDVTRPAEAKLAAIERAHRDETAGLARDATIAIVATVPLLVIAMAHGVFEGAASVIAQLALGTLVVIGPGSRYLRAGWRAAAHRSPDMNTLIALGAGAAWLSSAIAAVRWLGGDRMHAPALYFEAGAAIVAVVMIGKLLEARARAHLADAVRGLVALAPPIAHTQDGRDVDASAVAPGDVIVVRPGERVPADGTVIDGRSAVDEAMLTGEALPVDKDEGAPVYAGTLNHHGALVVRVARGGAETSLAKIARAVEDAQGSKAPIARLADRVSAVFVPIVLAIAAATLVGWLIGGASTTIAVERMVAVLVIACPCALGLATPAAVAAGTARGAQLGVLFRTAGALEAASTIEVACFDKTGTLTTGKPALVGGTASDEILALAAAAESSSEHPIARALVDGARARGLAIPEARDVTAKPGAGVSARVGERTVLVGTDAYLQLAGIAVPPVDARFANATLCHVAIDKAYAGVLAVADPPRSDAREIVAALRELQIGSAMITGDREAVAQLVAKDVGITDVHAGVKPTDKAAIVRGYKRVAMIGDGINDAPALASADLGIAMGTGTEIAAASADVTLLRGIAGLPIVFGLARATLHTIRRNLGAAFIYNLVCIPIAAAGWLSPVLASAAMSLSSVTVLVSSLRLRGWK
jgi:Cu+-exporting ATPase